MLLVQVPHAVDHNPIVSSDRSSIHYGQVGTQIGSQPDFFPQKVGLGTCLVGTPLNATVSQKSLFHSINATKSSSHQPCNSCNMQSSQDRAYQRPRMSSFELNHVDPFYFCSNLGSIPCSGFLTPSIFPKKNSYQLRQELLQC